MSRKSQRNNKSSKNKSKRRLFKKVSSRSHHYNNQVWIARHQERLDQIDDTWYYKNKYFLDTPLSDQGVIDAGKLGNYLKHKLHKKDIIEIYSSPYQRCLESSLEIAKKFEAHTGKRVLIKVDYSIAESVGKSQLNKYESIIRVNGHLQIKRQRVNDFLLPNLPKIKPFKDYIDHGYTPVKNNTLLTFETDIEYINRIYKFINYLKKNQENASRKITMVVTHLNEFIILHNLMSRTIKKNIIHKSLINVSHGILTRLSFKNDRKFWSVIEEPTTTYRLGPKT